jgi:hypothetical protein
LLNFRTLKEFGCSRCQLNQAFQCGAEVTVALLVLLNPKGDLCLSPFQFARFDSH